jgi:hypothetical protein
VSEEKEIIAFPIEDIPISASDWFEMSDWEQRAALPAHDSDSLAQPSPLRYVPSITVGSTGVLFEAGAEHSIVAGHPSGPIKTVIATQSKEDVGL